jgi:predicted DNA-binding transcriptional regulator AlpA
VESEGVTVNDDDKLIDARIVAKRLGLVRGHREVYEWLRSPNPPPVYELGKNRKRFRWGEVLAWLSSRRRTA